MTFPTLRRLLAIMLLLPSLLLATWPGGSALLADEIPGGLASQQHAADRL